MLDLILHSLAVAAIAILMLGALGVALVVLWFVAAVIAWENTKPEVRD